MEKGVWPQGAETHPALREAVNTTRTSISRHKHAHTLRHTHDADATENSHRETSMNHTYP